MFEKDFVVPYFGITAGLNLVLTIVYQTWEEASTSWLPILWIASVLSVLLALLFYPIPKIDFEKHVYNGVGMSFVLNIIVVVGLLVSGEVGYQISAGTYAVGIVVFYSLPVIELYSKNEYTKVVNPTEVVNPMNYRQQRFAY